MLRRTGISLPGARFGYLKRRCAFMITAAIFQDETWIRRRAMIIVIMHMVFSPMFLHFLLLFVLKTKSIGRPQQRNGSRCLLKTRQSDLYGFLAVGRVGPNHQTSVSPSASYALIGFRLIQFLWSMLYRYQFFYRRAHLAPTRRRVTETALQTTMVQPRLA